MEKITLSTKKELDISPSSVQHHIKKLSSLGVVELDHTEMINGIDARYYKPTYVTVQIGLDHSDENNMQKEVLVQEQIARIYEGFLTRKKWKKRPAPFKIIIIVLFL